MGTALIDIYEAIGDADLGQDEIPTKVKSFVEALVKYQDEETSLWHQIIDKSEKDDNWIEASSSSLFLYTIAKAIKNGMVDSSYKDVVSKAYQGLLDHLVAESEDNIVVRGICTSASPEAYDYYVKIPTAENDIYGVGAFVLAIMAYYQLN